jgi:hypothetical protein
MVTLSPKKFGTNSFGVGCADGVGDAVAVVVFGGVLVGVPGKVRVAVGVLVAVAVCVGVGVGGCGV